MSDDNKRKDFPFKVIKGGQDDGAYSGSKSGASGTGSSPGSVSQSKSDASGTVNDTGNGEQGKSAPNGNGPQDKAGPAAGQAQPAYDPSGLKFLQAWVTDTRLMAVVVMCIVWRTKETGRHLHQFFYFDALEDGFERFAQLTDEDRGELRRTEVSFAGGLGGLKSPIDRAEAVHLFKHFYDMTRERGLQEPSPADGYSFLLFENDTLDKPQEEALFSKMCPARLTMTEIVNYFMMQIANGDDEGIRYLSRGKLSKDNVPAGDLYTLHKNDLLEYTAIGPGGEVTEPSKTKRPPTAAGRIIPKETAPMATSRVTLESLIETDDGYEIWRSAVEVKNGRVISFQRTARMEISDTEAYLALSHSEFVMVYRPKQGTPEFDDDASPLLRNATRLEEEDGYSYMLFRPNNDHVDSEHYRLYDDIFGIYHVTSKGQFICSSNSARDIGMLELDLVLTPAFSHMELIGNYEFNEPVMAEFIASGYDDFDEFMSEITRGDD